jgi:hypothetical protein
MSRLAAIGSGAVALMLCACSGGPAIPGRDSGWRELFPTYGLSIVEMPVDLPTHVTLAPNATLVDGSVVASAGIDIGRGPSLVGDAAFRDVGAQFADPATIVNLLCIWVDRALPPSVAAAYTWSAYASDDNVVWRAVALAGPVSFASLQNRFEISIQGTQARYLKVVTQPLAPGVTTDPTYNDVFVTELTFFSVTH